LLQNPITTNKYIFASFKDVYLSAWWETASVQSLSRLKEHQAAYIKQLPGDFLSLTLLYEQKIRSQTNEERALLEEISVFSRGRLASQAFFSTGGTLATGMLRLILSSLRLVSGNKYELEVSNDLNVLSPWVAARSSVSAKELSELLKELHTLKSQ
jgi:hypothetical protein